MSIGESIRTNVSIANVTADDAARKTPVYHDLEGLMRNHEVLYPRISRWFKNRVVPQLKGGGRAALVGYEEDSPVASAIVKPRGDTKFCHLHIAQEYRGHNLGELFFSLMAFEARRRAKRVHFTLPEGLWEEEREFFGGFGFECPEIAETQYREGQRELVCSAPFANVWKSVRNKLPKLVRRFGVGKHEMSEGVVMSIRPSIAEDIMAERKIVEVRRRFSEKWSGAMACIYASKPVSGLVGEAHIQEVIEASPATIWRNFGEYTGASKEAFHEYTSGCDTVYAIVFGKIEPYITAIPLAQLEHFLGVKLSVPQSYLKAEAGSVWSEAVSLATLLQRKKRRKREDPIAPNVLV